MRSEDLEVLTDGKGIDGGEENGMTDDLRDRVDLEFLDAGRGDVLSVRMGMRVTVAAAPAAARRFALGGRSTMRMTVTVTVTVAAAAAAATSMTMAAAAAAAFALEVLGLRMRIDEREGLTGAFGRGGGERISHGDPSEESRAIYPVGVPRSV